MPLKDTPNSDASPECKPVAYNRLDCLLEDQRDSYSTKLPKRYSQNTNRLSNFNQYRNRNDNRMRTQSGTYTNSDNYFQHNNRYQFDNQDKKLDFDNDINAQFQKYKPVRKNRADGLLNSKSWSTRNGRKPIYENEQTIFKNIEEKSKGINFDSYDNIEVKLSGEGAENIKPIDSFIGIDADINSVLLENIQRVRYDKLTPVQKYGLPILFTDRDLMACAQTGSGKTAAFLFPIIAKMVKTGPPSNNFNKQRAGKPVAVVISPTRELTLQIGEEAKKFAFNTGIATVIIYGGSEASSQIYEIQRGCDICIATPGRLIDIIKRGKIVLEYVKYLVLDEADRMLDMGFTPQITEIIENNDMPRDRQTAMFSATFPAEIQQLASRFMKSYIYLAVGRVGSTSLLIKQKFNYAEEINKPKRLLGLLEKSTGKVLVFVETKKKADAIEHYLVVNNIPAISIHGDKSQAQRNEALSKFKSGQCDVLVATDVASRGLDIHSISWVINLDLPHTIEEYVHRIGRTGRAGNSGLATSFVNEENRNILRPLLSLLQESNQEIPNWFIDLTQHCSSAHVKGFGNYRYHKASNNNNYYNSANNTTQDYRKNMEYSRKTINANNTSNYRNLQSSGSYNKFNGFEQATSNDCW